jgi:hypothetical protein
MSKEDVIRDLTNMFVHRFGVGTEVKLQEPIEISRDWQAGSAMLSKLRYINGHLEYYYDYWCSEWKSDKTTLNRFAIKALSQVLGIKVKTIVSYEYE